jgi:glycosyltransferase involved in cell wall biosynthesis
MAEQGEGNVKQEYNNATTGLNLDQSLNQIQKGKLTYALNAAVENFDSNSVNYQNELGNELCIRFPEGFVLLGEHFIVEKNKHIFFITNSTTGDSQIGYMDNNDCVYRVLVNAPCLNFNINYPIHKVVHRISNCNTEIYWTDGYNPRRYLDIDDIPKILRSGSPLCSPIYTDDLDCNQLKLQPNFNIPELTIVDVVSGGNLISGVYQFAIQYSDPAGNPFTSYYSVTNPTPIADKFIITNVNRNQFRKDIPTTIFSFIEAKRKWKEMDFSKEPFLYLHMNAKDGKGWDLRGLLLQTDLVEGRDYQLLDDQLSIKGVETDVLNNIYNASDVYLTTTLGEGWGLTLTEAMATKTPIICPLNTSFIEITKGGHLAYVLENQIPVSDMQDNLIRFMCDYLEVADNILYVAEGFFGKLDDLNFKENYQNRLDKAYEYTQSLDWSNVCKSWIEYFKSTY